MTDRAVVALGNPYRRDDGVGPAVLDALDQRDLSAVALLDLGDATFELVHVCTDYELVVIVDAVQFGRDPGDVAVFDPASAGDATGGQRGSHDTNPFDLLAVADRLDATPATVRLVGVQPDSLEFGEDLSPAVEAALPSVVDDVLAILEDMPDSAGPGLE